MSHKSAPRHTRQRVIIEIRTNTNDKSKRKTSRLGNNKTRAMVLPRMCKKAKIKKFGGKQRMKFYRAKAVLNQRKGTLRTDIDVDDWERFPGNHYCRLNEDEIAQIRYYKSLQTAIKYAYGHIILSNKCKEEVQESNMRIPKTKGWFIEWP